MRPLNLITLLLLIIGGINWLLVGLFHLDLVATVFGGQDAMLARTVYVLVGISALYQIIPFSKAISIDEPAAEGSLGHRH